MPKKPVVAALLFQLKIFSMINNQFLFGVVLSLFVCLGTLQAQDSGTQDQTLLDGKSIRITGIWAGSNHYASLYENTKVGHGAFVLAELNKDFLIGWNNFNTKGSGPDDLAFTLFTNELLFGYAHKSYKSIHPIIMLGAGSSRIIQTNPVTVNSLNDNVFVLKPVVGVELNAIRWIRISLEGGYRFAIGSNESFDFTDQDLSSFFMGLRFKFGWSWG